MSKRADPVRLERRSYPVHLRIETQFSDMDVVGHVNNVAIARFYESARSRFLMRVFRNPPLYRENRFGMVVAEYTIKFLAEANYPDPVDVGTGIGRIGRSSFTMQQALFQGGVCVGLSDAAMVLASDGKPMSIPDDVRERLGTLTMEGAA